LLTALDDFRNWLIQQGWSIRARIDRHRSGALTCTGCAGCCWLSRSRYSTPSA